MSEQRPHATRRPPFKLPLRAEHSGGDDWLIFDQERQVAIVASERHALNFCAAVNEYADLLEIASKYVALDPSPPSETGLTATEVNDALDLAECCVHDQMKNPNEREWVNGILKKLRAFALTNTPQAGAMTGTSFEGLKRPSSLDQPHQGRTPESAGAPRGAGASPHSANAAPARSAVEHLIWQVENGEPFDRAVMLKALRASPVSPAATIDAKAVAERCAELLVPVDEGPGYEDREVWNAALQWAKRYIRAYAATLDAAPSPVPQAADIDENNQWPEFNRER